MSSLLQKSVIIKRKLKATWTVDLQQDCNSFYEYGRKRITLNPITLVNISDVIEQHEIIEFRPLVPGSLDQFDLGSPTEHELTKILADEIKKEIDAEILKTMMEKIQNYTTSPTSNYVVMSPGVYNDLIQAEKDYER